MGWKNAVKTEQIISRWAGQIQFTEQIKILTSVNFSISPIFVQTKELKWFKSDILQIPRSKNTFLFLFGARFASNLFIVRLLLPRAQR